MPEGQRKKTTATGKPTARKKPASTRRKGVVDKPLFEPTPGSKDSKEPIAKAPARAAVGGKEEGKRTFPEPEGVVEDSLADSGKIRALERQNKELLVRIRKLELDRAKGYREDAEPGVDDDEVSEESQGILQIVRDFEAQLDDAFALKEALEADLSAMQAKLVEETATRTEVQGRAQLLEAQASLVEQLRDELSFVEEERTETARKLKENESQLDQITMERNKLSERMVATETHISHLEKVKVDLEAQVLNLEDTVADLEDVRGQFAQTSGVRDELEERVKDLTARLEASEVTREALGADLSANQDEASALQQEFDEARKKLSAAETRLAEMRGNLEERQVKDKDLMEDNRRLEREVNGLKAKNEVTSAELEATKKMLREVHTEVMRTSERIHSRYYKPSRTRTD